MSQNCALIQCTNLFLYSKVLWIFVIIENIFRMKIIWATNDANVKLRFAVVLGLFRKGIIIDKSSLPFSLYNVKISDNCEPSPRVMQQFPIACKILLRQKKAYFYTITFRSKWEVTTEINNLYTNASHSVIIISNRDNSRDEKYLYLQ